MTHLLRPSRLARSGRAREHGGRPFWLVLLAAAWATGCLPAKTPVDAPLTGEPSEAELLRAENAELSRRVHELRAEKAELKRQVALLELKVTSGSPEGSAEAVTTSPEAAPAVEAAEAAAPSAPASESEGQSEPASASTARVASVSAAAAAASRPVEAPVLISGSAEATDFDRGREALEAGAYQSAEQTLTRFLAANPRHPFADDALVLRGRARVGRRQFDAAERDFRQVADRYPDELVAPEAWLELVRLCQTRGDDPGARQASRALVDRYPDSAAASLVPSELLE